MTGTLVADSYFSFKKKYLWYYKTRFNKFVGDNTGKSPQIKKIAANALLQVVGWKGRWFGSRPFEKWWPTGKGILIYHLLYARENTVKISINVSFSNKVYKFTNNKAVLFQVKS